MRCRNARGETTVGDAGRYATHGDRKRDSVVARAISSTEPGSGVSGANACSGRTPASPQRLRAESARSDERQQDEWLDAHEPPPPAARGLADGDETQAYRRSVPPGHC